MLTGDIQFTTYTVLNHYNFHYNFKY